MPELDNNAHLLTPNCFFVYDNHNEDEFAKDEELMLYWYPPEVEMNKRLFLLGGCAAMLSFSKQFSRNQIGVLKMERMKLAIKEEGKVVMVLTSDASDTDEALKERLQIVYHAFQFYNGSFERLLQVNIS